MGGGNEGSEGKGLGKMGSKRGKRGWTVTWQRWFFCRYGGCGSVVHSTSYEFTFNGHDWNLIFMEFFSADFFGRFFHVIVVIPSPVFCEKGRRNSVGVVSRNHTPTFIRKSITDGNDYSTSPHSRDQPHTSIVILIESVQLMISGEWVRGSCRGGAEVALGWGLVGTFASRRRGRCREEGWGRGGWER